jgi:hypothetical protein
MTQPVKIMDMREEGIVRIDTELQRKVTRLARIYLVPVPDAPRDPCIVGVKPDGTVTCANPNHDEGECVASVRQLLNGEPTQ